MPKTTTTMPARWKFWESYSNALETLAAQDKQKAKDFLYAIYEYSSWGREPELGTDLATTMAWQLIKPNLDNSVKAHAQGAKGKAKATQNKRKEADEIARAKKVSKAMDKLYADYEAGAIPDWDVSDEEYLSADTLANIEAMRAETDIEYRIG